MMSDNYSMSRDPTLFEYLLLFDPDRWTREDKKERAFAHLPFGFGLRSCYGKIHTYGTVNLLVCNCKLVGSISPEFGLQNFTS